MKKDEWRSVTIQTSWKLEPVVQFEMTKLRHHAYVSQAPNLTRIQLDHGPRDISLPTGANPPHWRFFLHSGHIRPQCGACWRFINYWDSWWWWSVSVVLCGYVVCMCSIMEVTVTLGNIIRRLLIVCSMVIARGNDVINILITTWWCVSQSLRA